MLRLSQKFTSVVRPAAVRSLSSAPSELVQVSTNEDTKISIVTLNRPPVNSLNLDLLKALSGTLDQLLDSRSKGVILTSSSKTVFSAGLDIMEMYKPKVERAREFWTCLQDVWLKLYGSPFPTAAAINGHAPAGGCLLSLCCEYRVMLPNYTIGLNETQLGIVAPPWFQASMKNTIPSRQAELALTLGTLFPTQDALNVGLIDEVAESKDDAVKRCEKWLLKFRKVSAEARALTKQGLRSKDIRELEDNRAQDVDLFLFFVQQPKVQKGLEAYLESLKAKK